MGLIGLILAVSALLFCVYLWLELQKKLSPEDVASKLRLSSDELKETYAKYLREIETEWSDMYVKFSRLAGRIDKTRALESPQNREAEAVATGSPAPTRSDLLRKHRQGRSQ